MVAVRRTSLATTLVAALLSLFVAQVPQSVRAATSSAEVVLFWRTNTTFESVAQSAYTLIFISFAYIPDDNMFSIDLPSQCQESTTTSGAPPQRYSCKDGIAKLQAAGKKVGISIGGGDTTTSKVPRVFTTLYSLYTAGSKDMTVITRWAKMVADFMTTWNLDAVDFDNEEAHTAATGGTASNSTTVEALADQGGLDFMGLLQVGLRQAIGANKIFTVSLQPPFYGAPNIEDPASFNPIKFPVRPLAPWYNNLMYMFETNQAAYDALTYMIWMYYPKTNMWEWVSNPDTLTNPMQKYTIAPHDLNSTVNLAAIYQSQLAVVMQAGTVKSLNPKKMIIATQTNQPQQENAYVPGDEFYRQMAALPDAQKPAGYGVWTEYLTWDPAGCSYHDAVCQLSGICQVGTSAGCPPNVQAFTAPPAPGSTVSPLTGGSAGSTSGSTSNKTGTTTRSASAASATPSAAGANAGASSVSNNAVSQGRSFSWELVGGAACVLVALVGGL